MKKYGGFLTLVRQELYRFFRLIRQTIFPPVITTLLFILIFGYSLGDRIHEIHGFAYILYIIPGLAAMGVINNAYTNTSTSIYMSKFDQSFDNIWVTPLRPTEMVAAIVIGGIVRGLLIGIITLAVALLMLHTPIQHLFFTLVLFLLQSIIFGCWGIISALRAKSWDTLATTQNFILTPMSYLAGVFYSIDLLPSPWKTISMFNPLFYMVDATRFGVLGIHDAPLWLSFGITFTLAAGLFMLCIYLFHIGYKLVK